MSERLIVFTRYSEPGKAKTRLIPALGPEGAAALHRRMTECMADAARAARRQSGEIRMGIMACCTGAPLEEFRTWLGPDLQYASQPSGDLGARLQWAFSEALPEGAEAAIAVGADVPGLTPDIMGQAFEGLSEQDVTLGPAADGGYYLIGMKQCRPELFTGIDWGTGKVYRQTCEIIDRLGLKAAALPLLADVDRPEDTDAIRSDPRFADVFEGLRKPTANR